MPRCTAIYKAKLRSYSTLMCCECCCVDAPRVVEGSPCMDASGLHQLCELCGRRLSKVKHHRPHGPGRACAPQCKQKQRFLESNTPAAAAGPPAKQSRKRRAASDPGESPEPAASPALTRRIAAPKPAATSRQQYNTRREEQIMRLLDETHARRMAADAAASHL